MSVCITGDVNPDHLVRVVFIRIFYCKSNYVPFEMTKYLGERYFESLQISCFCHPGLFLCTLTCYRPFSLGMLYFLAPQETPGLPCVFPSLTLKSTGFLWSSAPFVGEWYLATLDLSIRFVHFYFECLAGNRTRKRMMCLHTSTPLSLHLKNTMMSLTPIPHHPVSF